GRRAFRRRARRRRGLGVAVPPPSAGDNGDGRRDAGHAGRDRRLLRAVLARRQLFYLRTHSGFPTLTPAASRPQGGLHGAWGAGRLAGFATVGRRGLDGTCRRAPSAGEAGGSSACAPLALGSPEGGCGGSGGAGDGSLGTALDDGVAAAVVPFEEA